ncbi:MAG: hypothetical protein RMY29_003370 [Nostoc sp. CreGUA01]
MGGVGVWEVWRWGGRGVKEASKQLLFFLIPSSPHLPSPHPPHSPHSPHSLIPLISHISLIPPFPSP